MKDTTLPRELENELNEQTKLADAGEAAAVLLHELGNVFNNVLLDTRLLMRELSEAQQERLAESCTLITEAAAQMAQLAQYRQNCRTEPYFVDVNHHVRQITSTTPYKAAQVHLAEELFPVQGTAADMDRLLRLLFQNALAVSSGKKSVAISTDGNEGHVELVIKIAGQGLNENQLSALFAPFQSVLPGWNGLELAICQNLARRMKSRLTAKSLRGELIVTVVWQLDSDRTGAASNNTALA